MEGQNVLLVDISWELPSNESFPWRRKDFPVESFLSAYPGFHFALLMCRNMHWPPPSQRFSGINDPVTKSRNLGTQDHTCETDKNWEISYHLHTCACSSRKWKLLFFLPFRPLGGNQDFCPKIGSTCSCEYVRRITLCVSRYGINHFPHMWKQKTILWEKNLVFILVACVNKAI